MINMNYCDILLVFLHVRHAIFTMLCNVTNAFIFRNAFNAELWKGESMTCIIMQMWGLHRQRLIHDYSLVGYILPPNPTIMSHAIENKKFVHKESLLGRFLMKTQ